MSERGDSHYLLGHTENELRRLDIQGDLYRDITRRAFLDAGIGPGMRVLDIGCGTGDVSLTVAPIVGAEGRPPPGALRNDPTWPERKSPQVDALRLRLSASCQ